VIAVLLSGRRLKAALFDMTKPVKERLIITPLLAPDKQVSDAAASVDVRLGQKFQVPRRTKLSQLNHLDAEHERNLARYIDETFVRIGDWFVLHPRQFVLGETLEWVHLPHDLSAYVVGRSSWGRDGLIIATATGVHPGYSGILTLEISNIGEIPVYLWPGVTIAQLFIQQVGGSEVGDRDQSAFQGSTEPRSANAAEADRRIIKNIKDSPWPS